MDGDSEARGGTSEFARPSRKLGEKIRVCPSAWSATINMWHAIRHVHTITFWFYSSEGADFARFWSALPRRWRISFGSESELRCTHLEFTSHVDDLDSKAPVMSDDKIRPRRRHRLSIISSTVQYGPQHSAFYAETTLVSHCHPHNPTPTPPVLASNLRDAAMLGRHETTDY
jgi:hypothetical protein